jgi:hypothetical protein
MAVYGTLATWARQLGLHDDARVLHAILQEEKRADEKLSRLAEQGVNREAAERDFGHARRSEGGHMSEYYDDAAGYVQSGGRAVVRQVEEQPLTAMLVAGEAGYLLGYLVHGNLSLQLREQPPRTRALRASRRAPPI